MQNEYRLEIDLSLDDQAELSVIRLAKKICASGYREVCSSQQPTDFTRAVYSWAGARSHRVSRSQRHVRGGRHPNNQNSLRLYNRTEWTVPVHWSLDLLSVIAAACSTAGTRICPSASENGAHHEEASFNFKL